MTRLIRFLTRRRLYERGYVDGFDAAERSMVPRAFEDGRIAARKEHVS